MVTNVIWMSILIVIIGFGTSILSSFMGVGGGVLSVLFVTLVIGNNNSEWAKLIVFPSLACVSILGMGKYIFKYREFPDWRSSIPLSISTIVISVLAEMYVAPFLANYDNYFPFIYAGLVVFLIVIINF